MRLVEYNEGTFMFWTYIPGGPSRIKTIHDVPNYFENGHCYNFPSDTIDALEDAKDEIDSEIKDFGSNQDRRADLEKIVKVIDSIKRKYNI